MTSVDFVRERIAGIYLNIAKKKQSNDLNEESEHDKNVMRQSLIRYNPMKYRISNYHCANYAQLVEQLKVHK